MSLAVTAVYGFDPEAGVDWASPEVLVMLSGNCLHFANVHGDSRGAFLWSAGNGISAFALNTRACLLAYAEEGISPRVFVHDLLSHEQARRRRRRGRRPERHRLRSPPSLPCRPPAGFPPPPLG